MFRFTIRELVLVTALVAMGVAWWMDRSRIAFDAGRHKETLMKLRRLGLDAGVAINSPELSAELEAQWQAENARRTQTKATTPTRR